MFPVHATVIQPFSLVSVFFLFLQEIVSMNGCDASKMNHFGCEYLWRCQFLDLGNFKNNENKVPQKEPSFGTCAERATRKRARVFFVFPQILFPKSRVAFSLQRLGISRREREREREREALLVLNKKSPPSFVRRRAICGVRRLFSADCPHVALEPLVACDPLETGAMCVSFLSLVSRSRFQSLSDSETIVAVSGHGY